MTKRSNGNETGVVALITVVILALLLFGIGTLLTIQSESSVSSGRLTNQADRAQFLAETGAQDALIRIARDKSYSGTSTITETDGSVDINVTINSTTSTTVTATSSVTQAGDTVKRSIRVDVVFVGADGEILSVTKTNQ